MAGTQAVDPFVEPVDAAADLVELADDLLIRWRRRCSGLLCGRLGRRRARLAQAERVATAMNAAANTAKRPLRVVFIGASSARERLGVQGSPCSNYNKSR
jgi:hypothetical protein